MCLGFFKKGLLYFGRKVNGVCSAFYLVYSSPIDAPKLPIRSVLEEKARNDLGVEVKITGRKRRIYNPVLSGALTM